MEEESKSKYIGSIGPDVRPSIMVLMEESVSRDSSDPAVPGPVVNPDVSGVSRFFVPHPVKSKPKKNAIITAEKNDLLCRITSSLTITVTNIR
jgi:hypothetical protein